ncbi:MAG: ExeM/NucH family extracellular endonuclease, partial [Chloroflexota bacterium]
VHVGDLVQVTGASSEYFGMSQLSATSAQAVTVISSNNPLPTPAVVSLPIPGVTATDLPGAQAQINAYYEPFEGMLLTVNNELTVTEYFELSRYGQVVLAQGGRFRQFTDANTPSATGYTAHLIDKAQRTIILDDDSNQQNHALLEGVPVLHPTPGFSITNYIRGGDTITDLTGVLHWSFAGQTGTDAWRLRPVTESFDYDFTAVNTRPATPDNVSGNLKVASFNVLNYFTTLDSRGADSVAELDRQAAKIVAAFAGLDADVIGVMEIENNNNVAIADLVSRLNADAGAGTYAYISTGTVGTDQITVGIIYKPGSVTPVGTAQILTDAVFTDPNNIGSQQNRPAVAQTFEHPSGEQFTVVVNHLKSKNCGSATNLDADQGDGQGCWNDTRQKAAAYLVNTWIPALTDSIGDPDFLIMGDLNSYRNEDPITNITDAGYSDLFNDLLGASAYGYVFDGQLGYLDHALASPSLAQQVTGVSEWHINADEVNLLDYNDTILDPGEASFEVKPGALPLFESNTYRSSDHDPVVVGISFNWTTYLPVMFKN